MDNTLNWTNNEIVQRVLDNAEINSLEKDLAERLEDALNYNLKLEDLVQEYSKKIEDLQNTLDTLK